MNHFQSCTEKSDRSIQSGPQLWAFMMLHCDNTAVIPSVGNRWGVLASLCTTVALGTKASLLSLEIYLYSKIHGMCILISSHLPKRVLQKKGIMQCS